MDERHLPKPPDQPGASPDPPRTTVKKRYRQLAAVALILVLLALIGGVTVVTLEMRELTRTTERLQRSTEQLDNEVVSLDTRLHSQRRVLASLATELSETAEKLPPDFSSLVSEVEGSVVTVHVGSGQGSGFAVDTDPPRGYQTGILTAEVRIRALRGHPQGDGPMGRKDRSHRPRGLVG